MTTLTAEFDAHQLWRVLTERFGLTSNAEIALAFSGGGDSHALFHALVAARREHHFTLTALHFDHGMAPQSAAWAQHCAAICADAEVAFITTRQPITPTPGESLEALARRQRYRWFADSVVRGQVLLTAHHADDQAETVLLNLLRGGGVSMLAGIAPQRPLSAQRGTRVLRPLLGFPRAALAEYARCQKLSSIDDPANRELRFDRNFLRHEILPRLHQRWPATAAAISTSAGHCHDTTELLDEVLDESWQRAKVAERRGVFCLAAPLAAAQLRALGPVHRANLLRHWVHRHGLHSPSAGQLASLEQQVFATNTPPRRAAVRWGETALRYFDQHLYLTRQAPPASETTWKMQSCQLGAVQLIVTTAPGGLDPASLQGKTLNLTPRRGGERMTLPNRHHSSALKKLFQQHAIPPWERQALPLLLADNQVAWAHGIGPAAGFACPNDTPGLVINFQSHTTDE